MKVKDKKTGEIHECLGYPEENQIRVVINDVVYLKDKKDYERVRETISEEDWSKFTSMLHNLECINVCKDVNRRILIPGDDMTEHLFIYAKEVINGKF